MKSFKSIATGLLWCIFVAKSLAQFNVDASQVVISATKVPALQSETTKSTTIIMADEIAGLPVNSIDELLRYYAGVNINQRGAFGVQSDIGLRGSTFSQVLVMIDGVRLNDPLTGHFNNILPITLHEIHHVEVIKGPGSVSFGPDAVGGIIHIKTKSYMRSPDEQQQNAYSHIAVGQHDFVEGEFGLQNFKGKTGYSLGLRRQSTDGETFDNPNHIIDPTAPETYNTFFSITGLTGSLHHYFNDSVRLYVRTGYDDRAFDAKYFYTQSTADESYEETDQIWIQTALEIQRNRIHRSIQLAHKVTNDLFVFNPDFAPNEHTMTQSILGYDYSFRISDNLTFAAGLQGLRRSIESTDRGDHSHWNAAIYSMAQGYHKDLKYSVGIRFERFGVSDSYEAVPQVSLAWYRGKHTFRSLIGRAYRAPDFTENFVSSQIPNLTTGRNLGNANLLPESSWSMDLGWDYNPNSNFTFSNAVFYRISDNLIDFTLTRSADIIGADNIRPDASYFYATNISNASTIGWEGSMSAGASIGTSSYVRGNINVTYLQTTNEGNQVSKYLANHPDWILNGGIELKSGKLSLLTTHQYIRRDASLVPDIGGDVPSSYYLANARVAYQIKQAEFYIDARNITNTQYQEILGARLPSRWILGGMKFELNSF